MTSIPISDAEFNEQITPFELKQLHSRDWMQRAARQYYSIDQSNYVYNHGEPRTSVNNLKFWIPVIVEMEASEPFITTKRLFASFFGIIKSEKHEAPTVVIPQHLYTLSLTTSDDTTLSAFKLLLAKFLETSSSELETRSRKYWEHEQKERPSAIAGDGLPRIEGEKDPATDVTETSPVSRLEPEASRRDVNARSLDVMKDSTLSLPGQTPHEFEDLGSYGDMGPSLDNFAFDDTFPPGQNDEFAPIDYIQDVSQLPQDNGPVASTSSAMSTATPTVATAVSATSTASPHVETTHPSHPSSSQSAITAELIECNPTCFACKGRTCLKLPTENRCTKCIKGKRKCKFPSTSDIIGNAEMSAALADGEALLQRVESETQEKDGQQVYQGKDPWWEKDATSVMGTEYPLPGDHRPLWEVFGRMYPIYHLRSKNRGLTSPPDPNSPLAGKKRKFNKVDKASIEPGIAKPLQLDDLKNSSRDTTKKSKDTTAGAGPCSPCPQYYPTLEEIQDIPKFTQVNFDLLRRSGIAKLILPPGAVLPLIERILNKGVMRARPHADTKSAMIQTPIEILPDNTGCRLSQSPAIPSAIKPFDLFQEAAKQESNADDHYPAATMFKDREEFAVAAAHDKLWVKGSSKTALDWDTVRLEEIRFFGKLDDTKLKTQNNVEREVSFHDDNKSARPSLDLGNMTDQLAKLAQFDAPECPYKAPGISTTMTYLAARNTFFALHKEDLDLCSLKSCHFGAPKVWYSIGEKDVLRTEKILAELFSKSAKRCDLFLRHKEIFINPQVLVDHGVEVFRAIQYPNEVIITMPQGYHWGFNSGYAYNEAVNYTIPQWEAYGAENQVCACLDVRLHSWTLLSRGFKEAFDIELYTERQRRESKSTGHSQVRQDIDTGILTH